MRDGASLEDWRTAGDLVGSAFAAPHQSALACSVSRFSHSDVSLLLSFSTSRSTNASVSTLQYRLDSPKNSPVAQAPARR